MINSVSFFARFVEVFPMSTYLDLYCEAWRVYQIIAADLRLFGGVEINVHVFMASCLMGAFELMGDSSFKGHINLTRMSANQAYVYVPDCKLNNLLDRWYQLIEGKNVTENR